jgi:hypothetical protein
MTYEGWDRCGCHSRVRHPLVVSSNCTRDHFDCSSRNAYNYVINNASTHAMAFRTHGTTGLLGDLNADCLYREASESNAFRKVETSFLWGKDGRNLFS